VQPPPSDLNATLSAFAAERLQHGARCTAATIDRYLLSAVNPPAAIAAVDRWDRQTDRRPTVTKTLLRVGKKGKGSPYSITERRVPELIPVLGSQPSGDVSHKPDGTLPLLSARPAVTLATLKRAAANFAAW